MIVDTGVLVAAADEADPDHPACAALLEVATELRASPFVIAEAAYLIGRQLGPEAEARFFRGLVVEVEAAVAHGDEVGLLQGLDGGPVAGQGVHADVVQRAGTAARRRSAVST